MADVIGDRPSHLQTRPDDTGAFPNPQTSSPKLSPAATRLQASSPRSAVPPNPRFQHQPDPRARSSRPLARETSAGDLGSI